MFKNYIGQEALKKKLSITIQAKKKKNEPLPHILLSSSRAGGAGKTHCANTIGEEIGRPVKDFMAGSVGNTGDLAKILFNLEKNDILFLDEIHSIKDLKTQECLYSAMEDFRITTKAGNDTVTISIKPFTLIGATTEPGKLSQPLKSRFGIYHELEPYSQEELEAIVELNCPQTTREAKQMIARLSRGVPRKIVKIVDLCKDIVSVEGGGSVQVSGATVRKFMELNGINKDDFLTKQDIKYIREFYKHFATRPVGLASLSSVLQYDKDLIETDIEPWLISEGYIAKSSRGRVLQQKGFDLAQQLETFEKSK